MDQADIKFDYKCTFGIPENKKFSTQSRLTSYAPYTDYGNSTPKLRLSEMESSPFTKKGSGVTKKYIRLS